MVSIKAICEEQTLKPLNDSDDLVVISEMINEHKAAGPTSDITDSELIDLIERLINREG